MNKPASSDRRFMGLNVELNPTIRRYDEMTISYPSGNRLEYHKDKASEEENYIFNYYHGGNILRLNDLVSKSKWIFIPVDNNFRIKINTNHLSKPEIQLKIIGGGDSGLGVNEIYLLEALHEIGHAKFIEIQLQILLEYLNGNKKQTLFEIVLQSEIGYIPLKGKDYMKMVEQKFAWLRDLPNMLYDEQLTYGQRLFYDIYSGMYSDMPFYFEERFAWACAFRILRKHKLLNQFNLNDFRHFYITHLMSYGTGIVKRKDQLLYQHTECGLTDFLNSKAPSSPVVIQQKNETIDGKAQKL